MTVIKHNIYGGFLIDSESHRNLNEYLEALKGVPRVLISQYDVIHTLNVSIAASIILYEYLKQWRQSRLDL
jgi:tRNA(Leu) C34 or U34 (ribose-2'-O)-methylase TrmL